MVEKPTININMSELSLNTLRKCSELTNELEYERAISLYLKLRKSEAENPEYTPIRNQLRSLIIQYEKTNWTNENQIQEEQFQENDRAEKLVRSENVFIQNRKELILEKLKSAGLNQTNLAQILGHRKSYMSELINGLRPFSKDDIVVLYKLLDIKLEYLIPPFIQDEKARKIQNTLKSMGSSLLWSDVDF